MTGPRSPELIVALDNCTPAEAARLADELSGAGVRWFKVGLELYTASGPQTVRELKKNGANVFLDLKLYDIPNTVAQAVRASADTGADLLTIHCSGGPIMLEAAQKAAQSTQLALLGVTVLTSFGEQDFPSVAESWGARSGSSVPRGSTVLSLARSAAASGLPGIVCSASDLHDGELKKLNWKNSPLFVTPGIRNVGDAANDQKAVTTASQAVQLGSTHLVVGRPITAARDRAAAAQIFLKQIKEAHGVSSHS